MAMQPFDPEQEHLALRRQAAAQLTWRGGTLLAWCLWLLGSWMMALGQGTPQAVRAMMLLVMVGLLLLWPALRLSQDRRWAPNRLLTGWDAPAGVAMLPPPGPFSVLMDWLGMALIAQAVVWPFKITASWTLSQTLWVNAAVLSWSLLVAALVAWGVQQRRGLLRTATMLLCVALFLGEPLLMSLAPSTASIANWRMHISPLQTIWHLTQPGGAWSFDPWTTQVLAVMAAAFAAWTLVFLLRPRQQTQDQ